jgi:ankyrin repeat protein
MDKLRIQALLLLFPCVALASNAHLNVRDRELIAAATDKNPSLVATETALVNGADINARDGNGMTALMHMAQAGDRYQHITYFLIEAGADLTQRNKQNEDVFTLVQKRGYVSAGIWELLKLKCRINAAEGTLRASSQSRQDKAVAYKEVRSARKKAIAAVKNKIASPPEMLISNIKKIVWNARQNIANKM